MIAKGNTTITLDEVMSKVSEGDILAHYLGVKEVPALINSPLREDKKPSFSLYSYDGIKIYWKDFATNETGGIFDLLIKMWCCSFQQALNRVDKDIKENSKVNVKKCFPSTIKIRRSNSNSDLQVKVRAWRDYDIEYWNTFGISLIWLKWADVYPISYKIIFKDGNRYTFNADKYAYAFVERKEGKVSIKVYQPFNKLGYKWSNKNDGSVIGLWAKLPEYGDKVCICSSLKDSLCLSANLLIHTIYLQGEGYSMSDTAIKELKRRFKQVFICFDNDSTGRIDSEKLSEETGFSNIILPSFSGGKDIAEYYQQFGHNGMIDNILPLFNPKKQKLQWESDLPFDVY